MRCTWPPCSPSFRGWAKAKDWPQVNARRAGQMAFLHREKGRIRSADERVPAGVNLFGFITANFGLALAARNTPLDRRAVATPAPELPEAAEVRAAARLERGGSAGALVVPVRQRMTLRAPAVAKEPVTAAGVVPDIVGQSLRDAVRALHAAGFRVRVEGSGRVRQTLPAAGASARGGSLVRVLAEGA